jgi:hypothetical protein
MHFLLLVIECTCHQILLVAVGESSVVEMVFSGNVAQHLVGKGVDILALVSFAPTKTSGLIGRNCIMDITVSRYSLCRDDICFQTLKFHHVAGTISCFFGSAGSDSGKNSLSLLRLGVQ